MYVWEIFLCYISTATALGWVSWGCGLGRFEAGSLALGEILDYRSLSKKLS